MKLVGVWVARCGELSSLETHKLGYAGLDQPSSLQQPFLGGTSNTVAMRVEKERIVTVGDEVWEDEASDRVLRSIFVSRSGRHVEQSRMEKKTTGVPGYMMESLLCSTPNLFDLPRAIPTSTGLDVHTGINQTCFTNQLKTSYAMNDEISSRL